MCVGAIYPSDVLKFSLHVAWSQWTTVCGDEGYDGLVPAHIHGDDLRPEDDRFIQELLLVVMVSRRETPQSQVKF